MICIEHNYINRVDIEKVTDEFSSEKVRSKFFSNRFILNLVKEVNQRMLCFPKGILALPTSRKPQLKSFFVPIIHCCLRSLQMSFKSFFSGYSVALARKKEEISRGLICDSIISPHSPLELLKTPIFCQGKGRGIPSPKY